MPAADAQVLHGDEEDIHPGNMRMLVAKPVDDLRRRDTAALRERFQADEKPPLIHGARIGTAGAADY